MLHEKTYAQIYDLHANIVDEAVDRTLAPILGILSWIPNENILDLGCGTGCQARRYLAPLALANGGRVHAIDISKSMIEAAKAQFPHSRVEYTRTSVLAPDFPYACKFGKIFSLFVLHSDPNYRESLGKMYELLSPGGAAMVAFISKAVLFDCRRHVKSQAQENLAAFAEHVHVPDWDWTDPGVDLVPHFKEIVEGIGFKAVRLEAVPSKYTFKSVANCADFFMAENPHPFESHLAEEGHEAIHAAFCEALGEDDGRGPYDLDWEMLTLFLEKPKA